MGLRSAFYTDYQKVAAGVSAGTLTGQAGVGAIGDVLEKVVIIPATTSPGAVSIQDGAGSAITIFTGGASSVADLKPFEIQVRARSLAGAWKVTTGTNVSVFVTGRFQ